MAIRLKTFNDYLDFLKRRKYHIAVTWLLISVISVLIAYKLPKTFRSTATLLIEAPIPAKILENMPLQYADEQLQSIFQRVMTTENVYSIIESSQLYSDTKAAFTKHEIVDFFKKSTEVELATSAVSGKTNTGSGIAEIAFNISFSDKNPQKAQEIASQLAQIFIEQNNKSRTERAGKATDFLQEESNKLNHDLEEVDRKIVQYKETHNFSLPEQMQGNLAAIDRAESEQKDIESQIRNTKERIIFLSAELAKTQAEQQPSSSEVTKTPSTREDILAQLQADYLKASQIYSPNHPTMQRLKREISAYNANFGNEEIDNTNITEELSNTKKELVLKEKTYAPSHPDIVKLKKQIASLEKQYDSYHSLPPLEHAKQTRLKNPAYLILEAQYKSSQSELESLLQKRDYLKSKLEKLHNIVTIAPQVEMGYSDLIRERDSITKKYTQLKEKLADAKVFQTLEEGQQGQTLTILEKPVVPRHPEKAIRRKVAIGGFFLGLLAGIGLAFALEFLDPAIRGYRAVTEITGLMPIVVIPYLETPEEEAKKLIRQQRTKKIFVCFLLSSILILSAFAIWFISHSGKQ